MTDFLTQLLRSLDALEVRGKDNLDILLGCMVAIENKLMEIEAPKADETEGE